MGRSKIRVQSDDLSISGLSRLHFENIAKETRSVERDLVIKLYELNVDRFRDCILS